VYDDLPTRYVRASICHIVAHDIVAQILKLSNVWDPSQVLFSGHGTEATDIDDKAREGSAVKSFADCQLCSLGGGGIA